MRLPRPFPTKILLLDEWLVAIARIGVRYYYRRAIRPIGAPPFTQSRDFGLPGCWRVGVGWMGAFESAISGRFDCS
jgi:hypothetical protein